MTTNYNAQELSDKARDAYERSEEWLMIANIRIEKGLDASDAERKSEYWLIRYNVINEQLSNQGKA